MRPICETMHNTQGRAHRARPRKNKHIMTIGKDVYNMRFSRFMSAIIAMSLAAAMVIPVYAASPMDDAELSEFAGGTMTCGIAIETANGPEELVIEVPIPVGTTKDEQSAIVIAAAQEAVYGPNKSRSVSAVIDTLWITELSDPIVANTSVPVGSGTLPKTYTTLAVLFNDAMPDNGCSNMIARINNTTAGTTYTKSRDFNQYLTNTFVYFITTQDGVRLNSGDAIEVYASTDTGYFDASSCEVWGSVYDLSQG